LSAALMKTFVSTTSLILEADALPCALP
jgi:hypothetical protein